MANPATNIVLPDRDHNFWRSKIIRGRLLIVLITAVILTAMDYFDHDSPQHPAWQDADFWFGFPIYGLLVPALVWVVLKWSSRLLEERRSVEHEMAVTNKLGMRLTSLNQPEKLEQEVLRFCKEVVPGADITIYGFDQAQGRYHASTEILSDQSSGNIGSPNGCFTCLNVSKVGNGNQVLECTQTHQGNLAHYCLPIRFKNYRMGLLQFSPRLTLGLEVHQQNTLNAASPEIAFALMNRMLEQERLNTVTQAADECHRIAWDLHDHLGQDVTYLRLKLEQLQTNFDRQTKANIKQDLTRMLSVADQAYDQVSKTLSELYSEEGTSWQIKIEKLGITIASKSGFNLSFYKEGTEKPLAVGITQTIFYICREALNNISEHAKADQVSLKISWRPDQLKIDICDDGKGFDLANPIVTSNFGLKIMRERAASINADLVIHSKPLFGTKIELSVPYLTSKPLDLDEPKFSLAGVDTL